MSALDVFTVPVLYKYKTKFCSFSAFVVLTLIIFTLVCPLIIVQQLGGFWLRSRVHVEMPKVNFMHQYSLVGVPNRNMRSSADKISSWDVLGLIEPITCESLAWKDPSDNNDCVFVKTYEVDVDKDRKNDVFHFEFHVRHHWPILRFIFTMYFHIELKELVEVTIEAPVTFDFVPDDDAHQINFTADLHLNQRGTLRVDGLPRGYYYTDLSIGDRFTENERKKFSPRLENTIVTSAAIRSELEPTVISGKIFYSEELIHYQPGYWEEIKWAWIQYLSFFLVFAYICTRILQFLFANRILKSFVTIPWKAD